MTAPVAGSMPKVGILRGNSLTPYEWQTYRVLPKHGFQPIGIVTFDSIYNVSDIPFPTRVGNNFKTLTGCKLIRPLRWATRFLKQDFSSINFWISNFKELTDGLEIIHSWDVWYPYTYQAVKTGIPTVVTEWENIPYNYEKWPYVGIKKYNRKHVAHFIAATQKAKEALMIEGVEPERITIVPGGMDCELFKPRLIDEQVIKKLGVSKGTVKILFNGRLVPEKGIFDLLNAFGLLVKKTPNVVLLIKAAPNSPRNRNQIHALISKLEIGSRVRFIADMAYSDLSLLHNVADIFCLPSTRTKTWAEQFGYSLAEAMACGKPVVSTWSGSIPEVVEHRSTGLLVPPHNPAALGAALEELTLNKSLRERYGKNAREWVLEKFEINHVASQIADVYRRLI
jgi:starch synthase